MVFEGKTYARCEIEIVIQIHEDADFVFVSATIDL